GSVVTSRRYGAWHEKGGSSATPLRRGTFCTPSFQTSPSDGLNTDLAGELVYVVSDHPVFRLSEFDNCGPSEPVVLGRFRRLFIRLREQVHDCDVLALKLVRPRGLDHVEAAARGRDRKSTRLNPVTFRSRMPSSARKKKKGSWQ